MSGPKTPATLVCADVSRRASSAVDRFCLAALLLILIPSRLICAGDADSSSAQNPGTRSPDSLAKWAIFQDEAFQDNSRAIHDAAAAMPAAERFEFLADWVLPNNQHPTFRVTAEFGSTNPPPFAEQPSESARRLTSGIVVISPAVDLVETAQKLGRLDELRDRIVSAVELVNDARPNYVQATLRFLVEVAREDFDAATLVFDEVIDASTDLDAKTVEARWPALLMLRAAIASQNEEIRRHVTEFFFSIYLDLKDYSPNLQRDVLNDHLRAMFALNVFLGKDASIETRPSELSEQWLPFVYSDSETRGYGRPSARWHSAKGRVEKLSGHEMDYLSFRSPLRGNYEIGCDFAATHGNHFSFLVAGSQVQAVSDGESLRTGNFRKHFTDTVLDLPLTKYRSIARFRAVAKDGVLRQFLNGQEVLKKQLAPEHDPWVAIRAWRRSLGNVSDFRITGEPVIPEEINLTGDPELSGWTPYFEFGFGPGSGNWQASDAGQGKTEIKGRRRPEYAGSSVQKLLRYCRPVAEDGTIEYDFYYKEGEACVHPALDRLAFILDPDGVRIHWITDRRHERFLRDPANLAEEPENRRGPAQLPLNDDAWNRLRLDVTGDTIQLALNGQAIYQRTLEDSNQRTFGLFHYADRTAARIRNVVWRGDWPKELPSLKDQHLADTTLDFLNDERQQLVDHFHHDFRDDPLFERFNLVGNESGLTENQNGARMSLVSHDGAKQLRSALRISGDFDITASFEELEQRMDVPGWELRVGFVLHFDSEITDACGFYRTLARNEGNRRVNFNHSSRPKDKPHTVRSEYIVEESMSGRLRMARRGKTIYALYATADSPNFRLVDKREVTDAPVTIQGLRMILMGFKNSSVGVTWKELDVRADELSGLPLTDPAPVIAKLNARRDSLPARRIDFADTGSVDVNFVPTAVGASVLRPQPSGLRVTTVSSGEQQQFVLASRIPFKRGVDVEFTMDIHKFGLDDTMASPCEIALKVLFETSERNSLSPREATFILRKKANGVSYLVTRIVHRNNANNLAYRELHLLPVDSPDSFRVAVHEGTMYFLYSESNSDEYRLATTAPISGELPAVGVQLKFVTNGKDHKSDLTLTGLTIHEHAVAEIE